MTDSKASMAATVIEDRPLPDNLRTTPVTHFG